MTDKLRSEINKVVNRYIDNGVAELVPGDLVRLKPGARVAADGEITEGEGAIDEAMLTGEPVPAVKRPGDPVTGATINAGGRLVVHATRVGADTQLSQMGRLVEDAQAGLLHASTDDEKEVGHDALLALLDSRSIPYTTWEGWLALDAHELSLGTEATASGPVERERVKVVAREEMTRISRTGLTS